MIALAFVLAPLAGWRTSARSLTCDITQITFTTVEGSRIPAISGDGTRIAILSNSGLAGGNEISLATCDEGDGDGIPDDAGAAACGDLDPLRPAQHHGWHGGYGDECRALRRSNVERVHTEHDFAASGYKFHQIDTLKS